MQHTIILILLALSVSCSKEAEPIKYAYSCEKISQHMATYWLYCDLEVIDETMVPEFKKIAQDLFDVNSNQVHLKIFNDKSKVPKSYIEQGNMSDSDLDEHYIVDYNINKNSNHRSFYCKKSKNNPLENCSEFL